MDTRSGNRAPPIPSTRVVENITAEQWRNDYAHLFKFTYLMKRTKGDTYWNDKNIRLRFLKHVCDREDASFTDKHTIDTLICMMKAWFDGEDFDESEAFAPARPKMTRPQPDNRATAGAFSVSTAHSKNELYDKYVNAYEKVYGVDHEEKSEHVKPKGVDRFQTDKNKQNAHWFAETIQRLNSTALRNEFRQMTTTQVRDAIQPLVMNTVDGADDKEKKAKATKVLNKQTVAELEEMFIDMRVAQSDDVDDAQAGL
jgi:hypothetical protein